MHKARDATPIQRHTGTCPIAPPNISPRDIKNVNISPIINIIFA